MGRDANERVRLARFTSTNRDYGASRLPKTTILQSKFDPTQLIRPNFHDHGPLVT